MCSPAWMIGLQAVQGLNQYNQTKQQYNANIAMANQQAQTAEQNARIQEKKEEQTAEQYASKQAQLNARMKLAAGQATAQAGANGVMLSGSPLDSLSSSYQAWNDDSATLLQNQRNDIWSQELNRKNYINQANAYRASAANLSAQKQDALWGTLLTTAAGIYGIKRAYGSASKATAGENTMKLGPQATSASPAAYQAYTFGSSPNGIKTTLNSGLFGSKAGKNYTLKYPWSRKFRWQSTAIRPVNLDAASLKYDGPIRPVNLDKWM